MQRIRSATLDDLPAAYAVCLATGDAGRDASRLFRDPDLLGEVYVGPYVVGQPEFALVVEDDEGVAGYCLAALDTRRFEAWQASSWWPALRERHPRPHPGAADGSADADARLIALIHAPPLASAAVVASFPAHLHIDLLDRLRGSGLGRELIERQSDALTKAGASGVHLEVDARNEPAIGFYRHLGFTEVETQPESLVLGRRLGGDDSG